jgi:hypothetical protein
MFLMLALAKIGRNPGTGIGAGDVAYRLIHNDTFPSWGSLHQTRRHQHLGALERLDARDRLRCGQAKRGRWVESGRFLPREGKTGVNPGVPTGNPAF